MPKATLQHINHQDFPTARDYTARAYHHWQLPPQQDSSFLSCRPLTVYHQPSQNLSALNLNVGSEYHILHLRPTHGT